MLKGINPLLNADVLHVLRAMGHGDDLIIADTNFPSDSVARQTVYGRLLRIDDSAADVVKLFYLSCQLIHSLMTQLQEWKLLMNQKLFYQS